MLKWGKQPEANKAASLDKIQLLPNELRAAAKNNPGDLSEQEWYEANKHRLDLTSRRNNIHARQIFAWAIFAMVCSWLSAVLIIVALTGAKTLVLDKTVLITLITSGSVNVISLFSFVAKYLFHVHEAHEPVIESKSDLKPLEEKEPSQEAADASGKEADV